MSSDQDAVRKASSRRDSSRARAPVVTSQEVVTDSRAHRSKRESNRDLDAANIIDVSVPRSKEKTRRSESKEKPMKSESKEKERRSEAKEKERRSEGKEKERRSEGRPREARERSSKRHLDEADVKENVARMRESASKVRGAVRKSTSRSRDDDVAPSGSDGAKQTQAVGRADAKKTASTVKTPSKSTEPKALSRTSTRTAVETTTRKAVETSRHKPMETQIRKAVETTSRKAVETPRLKAVEKPSRTERPSGEVKSKKHSEEAGKERTNSKHRRPSEENLRDKAVRAHRKPEAEDKTKSKSRRVVAEGNVKEISDSRRRLAKEDGKKPQEDGVKRHRTVTSREKAEDEARKEKKYRAGGDNNNAVEERPRERTRTRVLSPSEVKIARDVAVKIAKENAMIGGKGDRGSERNGMGGYENMAVASTSLEPDAVFGSAENEDAEGDDDYEDDFEDYESDFEDDSSVDKEDGGEGSDKDESIVPELTARHQLPVEEEKKLDSGNYDMAENQKKSKYLTEIKAAMDKENLALDRARRDSSMKEASALVDEGFEEEKSEDLGVGGTIPRATSYINFANARKRQKEQKLTARARKRGDELLSMITLDIVKFKLFEMTPVPYDAYMSCYGRAGTVQAQVQTNDDRLTEEVQTDEIRTRDVWTQRPPPCGVGGDGVVRTTREQELLGVGEELTDAEHIAHKSQLSKHTKSVEQFLLTAAPLMMRALREGRSHRELQQNTADVGFSKGFTSLNVEALPFLANRPVTMVRYPPQQPTKLLTVHAGASSPSDDEAALNRCIICVWNLLDPTAPETTLAAWREVTAACFDSERATLVLGGLEDGSVCVWDLRDRVVNHDADGDQNWLLRSPTYSTAEVLKDEGHLGRVVSLQPLIDKDSDGMNEFSPTQVCSLEESGLVIVWTVIQSAGMGVTSTGANHDLGMAYWGRVRLVKTSTVSLDDNLPMDQLVQPNLLFSDMQINSEDCNHLFISTNTGQVVHSLKSGAKPTPRLYHPKSDGLTFAQCIETFPFGHSLFLVGCGDGSIRLHRRESENPLTILAGTGEAPGQGPVILALQWSRSRPTVFFVLDDLSRIHVWDLGLSDMYPRLTATPSTTGVSAIQMAPDLRDGKMGPQMVIATSNGTVQIHELKDEYRFRSSSDMKKELNNFIRFTNIL